MKRYLDSYNEFSMSFACWLDVNKAQDNKRVDYMQGSGDYPDISYSYTGVSQTMPWDKQFMVKI